MNVGDPLPKLGIVMPCLNEERHIRRSINSVLDFDYASDRMTLTVVDGMSTDRTREIVRELALGDQRLTLIDNPERLHGPALNWAINTLECDIMLRVDAHSFYPSDYAHISVTTLLETGASNVGGQLETVPGAETPVANAIAFAMSHSFGVGNSGFRTGIQERQWTDTVPFGCWHLSTLREVGGFATNIPFGEDDELNGRLIARGGKILLEPRLRLTYVARSDLYSFLVMLYRYGHSKPLTWRSLGRVPTLRQLVPLVFVLTISTSVATVAVFPEVLAILVVALGLHLTAGIIVSVGSQNKIGWRAASWLPLVFLSGHISYGTGMIRGIIRVCYDKLRERR